MRSLDPSSHSIRFRKRLNGRLAWDTERLAKLKSMCASHASYDDLNAAFPGFGISTLLVGMRMIIAEMVATK